MKARRLALCGCATLAVLAVAVPSASAASRDRTPPTAPTNLRVTGATEDSLTISWNASTDNSGRIESYVVYPSHWNGSGVYHSVSSRQRLGAFLFIGPVQPNDSEGHWIKTLPDKDWFVCFRISDSTPGA